MKVKRLVAKKILDTRGGETVEITLITNEGTFISSAPNGKSRGENEVDVWKKSLLGDINAVNKFFIEDINFREFKDLELIENSFSDRVGGNTMIALQYSFLKALAAKEDKQIWEIINSRARKVPFPVGNIIGGGAHNSNTWLKKPTFQEFHIIPMSNTKKNIEILKRSSENAKEILSNLNQKFKKSPTRNDESAWEAEINTNDAIQVIDDVKENMVDEFEVKVHMGIDVAASEFFNKNNYVYGDEKLTRDKQIKYIQNLSDKFYYIEDPLEQNDFQGFSEIRKKSKGLVVGDDLTTSNPEILKQAIKNKSINAIIIKPNQIGSLLKIKELVEISRKNDIKTIFSHRSGETKENILSDLSVGFNSDFIKTGALGPGRIEKLKRLIEIEDEL